MPRSALPAALASLLLLSSARAQPLLLATCDYSAAGAAAQLFAPTTAGGITLLAQSGAQCIRMSSGCCSGEDVRGGDALSLGACSSSGSSPPLTLQRCDATPAQSWYFDETNSSLLLAASGLCMDVLAYGVTPGSEVYTAPCHHDDPAPGHQNQAWRAPARAPPGAPLVEIMSSLPLDAFGGGGPVPGAVLTLCAAAGAAGYYLNATSPARGGTGALVHAATGLCVDAGAGAADATSAFAWPAAGGGPIVATAPARAGGVSPSMNGAPLVIAAKGRAFPGAPVQLLADRGPADSAWLANASAGGGGGARLVHAASGLCLAAGGAVAWEGPPLALAPCDAARQTPGDFFGSQLFRVPPQGGAAGAIATSRAGQCVTAEHVWGAHNAMPGEVRLIGATCAAGAAAQTFAFLANGSLVAAAAAPPPPAGGAPAPLVVDAGAGAWRGAPLSLQPTAGAASTIFAFRAVGADAALGTLTHAATGLCLDAGAVPFGVGCLHPRVRALPYCDAALPLAARVADLVSRLTLQEAQGYAGAGEFPEPCVTDQDAVRRLDVPPARQLVEVTSMASSSCSNPYAGGCATAFASGLLLGGSFNRSVWLSHGITVGREMRALSNIASVNPEDPNGNFVTLSGHGPDINQPRDPRNGRLGELISEDPFLTGRAAEKYVRGMQFGGDVDAATYAATGAPYVMVASLKHFNAYSLETNRMSSTGNVSMFDLWETYLPQYERAMVAASAAGTMCSYFSMRITPNSSGAAPVYVPSCADAYLLNDVVRTYWDRPDATHLTDCGAVWNMAYNNRYTDNNLTLAAAASINAGCDMNSNTITPTQLTLAVQLGLVTEATVRATAARVLAQRFRTGHFDPLEAPAAQPLLALGAADVGTAASRAAAAEGVAQGLVLVKNARGALPIAAGRRVALLGPQGASFDALLGDCYCSGYCAEGSACFPSLQQAVTAANVGGTTVALPGVTVHGNDSSWGAALAAVPAADVVILALGTDRSVAGEGSDRSDGIGLPGLQAAFGAAVLAAAAAAKVPVVLLLLHNLPVSFDELVGADAIVDAWAPLAYADTVAAALFGRANRWGKASLTVYPKAYAGAVSLFDFSMSAPPGRSYKYYDGSLGEPLIAFGSGGSYSTFAVACALLPPAPAAQSLAIACNVSNVAGPAGDEVLMVYHRPSAAIVARVGGAHPLPLRALVGFERVSVAAGATAQLQLELPLDEACAFVNEDGASVLYPGAHLLDVSNGNGANITLLVELQEERIIKTPPRPRQLPLLPLAAAAAAL